MTAAIAHRGPDDEQHHIEPGVALGNRRLAIIDVAGGRQPICNETGEIWVAYEGELYDYPELRRQLLSEGHMLSSHCDTEAWVHLYENHGEAVISQLHGQFGVSLWDRRNRRLLLARDRIGIAPLFYAEVDGWLLWGSEIKAILASRLIDAVPDRHGIDYFFNFFAHSNTRTCFQGIRSLPAGHFLRVEKGTVRLEKYWDLTFPDAGAERRFARVDDAIDEYEDLLRGAIRRRLVGEQPICCYISGGLDSTTILAMTSQENGAPLPSFTIGLSQSGTRDERKKAAEAAEFVESPLTTLDMGSDDIAGAYPDLIRAAEGPVLDTSAACTLRLADEVRKNGCVVSLTGEGADESLAGYIWFKAERLYRLFGDFLNSSMRVLVFRGLGGRGPTRIPWKGIDGIRPAQQVTYEMMAHSRHWLYSAGMWNSLRDYSPWDELGFNGATLKRWAPLNRSLYVANKIMLPGLLLSSKGDRAVKSASTEGRFPFLDERVVDFCARLHPDYKLRGLTDKWLLRKLAQRILPPQIADRRKTMFRANLSRTFLGPDRPAWVDQLLSPSSLAATGFFDPADVRQARDYVVHGPKRSFRRFVLDMGLTGVVSTQLWHHTYCGGGLADLPTWNAPVLGEAARPSGLVRAGAGGGN